MSLSTILKRSRCMGSTTLSHQNIRYDSILELTLVKNNEAISRLAEGYIDGLICKEGANQNYAQAIDLLAYYNENQMPTDKIFSKIQEMVYYLEDMDLLLNKVKYSNIAEKDATALTELANDIKIADRVLKNSKVLNEKMNFENNIRKIHRRPGYDVVKEASRMIGSYKFKPYQEMNMVMEQLGYLKEKDNFTYGNDIYQKVFEYYSFRNEDKENFIRVMKESSIVPDDVKADFNDRLERLGAVDDHCSSIITLSNYIYLQMDYDNIKNLHHMVYHTIRNTSVIDICNNMSKLFDIVDNVLNNLTDKTDNIGMDIIKSISAGIRDKELDITSLNDIYNALDCLHGKYNEAYISHIQSDIKDMRNMIYSVENLKAINVVFSSESAIIPLDEFKDIKFKGGLIKVVHNLDKFLATKEKEFLDRLKKKAKPALDKTAAVLFGESSNMADNIYSYIGSDNKVDICVRQYFMSESVWEEYDNTTDTIEFLDEVISKYNYSLDIEGVYNIRAYYKITEGVAEIHVKDSTKLKLTEEETQLVREAKDPAMDTYLGILNNITSLYEEYKDLPNIAISDLVNYNTIRECKLTDESYLALMEAIKYVKASTSIAEQVSTAYSDIVFERYLSEDTRVDNKLIENTLAQWAPVDNVPINVALEAFDIISTIIYETSSEADKKVLDESMSIEDSLDSIINESSVTDHAKQNGYDWDEEDDEEDKDSDKDDDDEEDEEPKEKKSSSNEKPSKTYGDGEDLPKGDEKKRTKFNLNSAILAAKGLAGKAKHYSGKINEFITNLDHAINSYITAMKKAASDERREQIIKGSVIPSFKKCLKFGVGLVLLGVATGGIVAPIIAALGGLALDKKLTQKEKLLILDEIDTELEVIDKELAMADQNNQTNKYRALLRYKKDLQRQYQRIRYNIRVGQDTAYFKSDVGMQQKKD
ncbi:MAG: hypothetical protein IKR19_08740 [Acholeplasmatales bacterium]|nr:hypothetical protein [Acholeplasmatales bacterium]